MNTLDLNNFSDILTQTVRECMFKLIDKGFVQKRSVVRKLDTIDVSVKAREVLGNDLTSMPAAKMTEEESQALHNYWCLGVPPLLDGVLLMNKDRYLVYGVTDINIDEHKYNVLITDYEYTDGTWAFNASVDATVWCDKDTATYEYKGVNLYQLLGSLFLSDESWVIPIDKETKNNLKRVVMPYLKRCIEQDAITGYDPQRSILNHFFTTIVRINCELQSGPKPKAVRAKGTKAKVKTITAKTPEKSPKPQIIRTLASGITIKSEKVPKAPTVEIIRHYKVASWNVRGHMRHYKTGKTVYIAPRVAKRKEFENENAAKRQTIIVSGGSKISRKVEEIK